MVWLDDHWSRWQVIQVIYIGCTASSDSTVYLVAVGGNLSLVS